MNGAQRVGVAIMLAAAAITLVGLVIIGVAIVRFVS